MQHQATWVDRDDPTASAHPAKAIVPRDLAEPSRRCTVVAIIQSGSRTVATAAQRQKNASNDVVRLEMLCCRFVPCGQSVNRATRSGDDQLGDADDWHRRAAATAVANRSASLSRDVGAMVALFRQSTSPAATFSVRARRCFFAVSRAATAIFNGGSYRPTL